MKCPFCGRCPIIPKYFNPNNEQISRKTPISQMNLSAIAECPKCQKKWSVFLDTQAETVLKSTGEISVGSKSKRYKIDFQNLDIDSLEVIETNKRSQEDFGIDERLIDNSMSQTTVMREILISKKWSRQYNISYENTSSVKGEIEGKFGGGLLGLINLNLKSVLEKSIKDHYSISEGTKLTFTERIEVRVKEKTKSRIIFKWKRLWQDGYLQINTKNGEGYQIPFCILVGVTFDQMQIDE
ncbi:MAG: hypothetical protein AAFX80_10515 [Cyanobacteria bacterium J06639_18]